MDKQVAKEQFESHKRFSDFLGFHVRCYFCAFIAWFALSSHTSEILQAIETHQAFEPRVLSVEVAVFLFLNAYALIMFAFICRSALSYLRVRMTSSFARMFVWPFFLIVLTLETLTFASMHFIGFIQPLRLMGSEQKIFCLLDKHFGPPNYGVGKPLAGCDVIR